MHTRPLPLRKSLGTGFNLRPTTERVPARALQVGDVVLESFEHPVRITRVTVRGYVIVHGTYIWQGQDEKPWMLDRVPNSRMFDRAVAGEY